MKKLNIISLIAVFLATFFVVSANSDNETIKKQNTDLISTNEVCQAEPDQIIEKCNAPEEIPNEIIAENAVDLCFGKHFSDSEKYNNALALLNVEDEMNIPSKMKGMTLAAACIESGFESSAKGDRSFSKDKKTPMAIGVLQMWPWYEKSLHVDRYDPNSSATGWLTNIKNQVKPVKKLCKTISVEDTWKVAWVTGVRAPKVGGRCNEVTKHWAFFKKMIKSMKNLGERT